MNNIPHSRRFRHVRVHSLHDLSPHLRRIVFDSPDLADYPFQCKGAHIKILLPRPEQERPLLPQMTERGPFWPDPATRPVSRAYTLRDYDRDACTLSIDFVRHGDHGHASRFAATVQIGQIIGISIPGGPVPMLQTADHYLIAGDLTALPAICAMLEDMAADAMGDVLLWLPEPADLPAALPLPPKICLHTFFGDATQKTALSACFVQCPPPQNSFVWLAGEASLVADLRRQARQIWQIPRAQCYAIPYWRAGVSEDNYHHQRHDFMDSDSA